MDKEYLEKKRLEVLDTIKPICEAFNIDDYDYEINAEGQTEVLRVCDVRIGCSYNSIDAVKNELIGFIFLRTWCRDRSLGAFSTQCKKCNKKILDKVSPAKVERNIYNYCKRVCS